MKIARFLMTPMKYLLLLLMFVAVIYYRSIIFHTNVTDPIDFMFSLVEHQFDIEIPAYVSKKPVIIEPPEQPEVVVEAVIEPEPVVPEMADVPETVAMIEEAGQATVMTEPEEQQAPMEEVVVIEEPAQAVEEKAELEPSQYEQLITELSATVDAINQKVDRLFEKSSEMVDAYQSNEIDRRVSSVESSTQQPAQLPINTQQLSDNNNYARNLPAAAKTEIVDTSDPDQMMKLARQSFWQGKPELAEKYYLDLSEQKDADPNVYGELGNVYYYQGKWKQAGQAYYEAALRLIELKQNQRAIYLLNIIQGLDEESAEKLRQKITSLKT